MKIKKVFKFSKTDKLFRLFRLIFNKGVVGDGKGYSSKLSFALSVEPFNFKKELKGFSVTFFFIRIHYLRSYGGMFV